MKRRMKPDEDDEPRPKVLELSPQALAAYAGRYYSEELDTVYEVTVAEKGLSAQVGYLPPVHLAPVAENAFMSEMGLELRFSRAAGGDVTGFVFDAPRVQGIRFTRGDGRPCP